VVYFSTSQSAYIVLVCLNPYCRWRFSYHEKCWGSINRLNPTAFVRLRQARIWIFICTFQVRLEVGDCWLFCWYWWNYWSSMFKLFFSYTTHNFLQFISIKSHIFHNCLFLDSVISIYCAWSVDFINPIKVVKNTNVE
jgi:hypothetical protein